MNFNNIVVCKNDTYSFAYIGTNTNNIVKFKHNSKSIKLRDNIYKYLSEIDYENIKFIDRYAYYTGNYNLNDIVEFITIIITNAIKYVSNNENLNMSIRDIINSFERFHERTEIQNDYNDIEKYLYDMNGIFHDYLNHVTEIEEKKITKINCTCDISKISEINCTCDISKISAIKCTCNIFNIL
jgi:hypothetical protein